MLTTYSDQDGAESLNYFVLKGYEHGWYGGASGMSYTDREVLIEECTFVGNFVNEDGGAIESLAVDLMTHVDAAWARAGGFRSIRLHGDLHPGNLLWRDGPFFVDLDDCRSGPAMQDLWMLLSGSETEMRGQLDDILAGYTAFCDFDFRETRLIEPLRALRKMIWPSGV